MVPYTVDKIRVDKLMFCVDNIRVDKLPPIHRITDVLFRSQKYRAEPMNWIIIERAATTMISATVTCTIRPPRRLCLQSLPGFCTPPPIRLPILHMTMAMASRSTPGMVQLQEGIAEFYDVSSGVWENMWGEHMHHGFYDLGLPNYSDANHVSAQIRMIDEALSFAGISVNFPRTVLDVGCGIGGSSRYLGNKYGASTIVTGITLSPVQARRANVLTAAQGLADRVKFQVADALDQPFPDGQFDLVWSMESAEHMPDKEKFLEELARVTAPGGSIIIVTWCHRDLLPGEISLRPDEQELLGKICDAYYLPAWCSAADYVKLAQALSLQDIKKADWSEHVAPFWPAVIRSALSWRGVIGLLKSGWKTIKGAFAMPLMVKGYKQGLIRFAVITFHKPE